MPSVHASSVWAVLTLTLSGCGDPGSSGAATLLGTLSFDQNDNQQWIPTASGPEAHSLNDANGRWIINGPSFPNREERAFAILSDL